MGKKINQIFASVVTLIKDGHPFLRIAIFAFPILLIFSVFFFWQLLPLASATSIQAGLTLIAEILGVLLGAVLVVIGLLIDQFRQAETILSTTYPYYRQQAEKDINLIVEARQQIVKGLLDNKFILEEKELSEKNEIVKKCISALSSLTIALEAEDRDTVWKELEQLGHSEGEVVETTWFESILAAVTPFRFFRLLEDGLNPDGINEWCSAEIMDYSEEIVTRMMREGIFTALHRHNSARDFLRSQILSITIIVITMALFITIFTIFGVSEATFHNRVVTVPIYFSLFGFLLSMILLPLSLLKMFAVGVES